MLDKSRSSHLTGVILIIVSAFAFSFAGVFTKWVETGAWGVIFWRGLFAAIFTSIFINFRSGFQKEYFNMGKSGIAVAIVSAAATACFLSAFKYTTIANVIIIYASAPIIAGLLAWVWANEKLSAQTVLACIVAFIGFLIILWGSVGAGSLKGDLLALGMTIGMSCVMVMYRKWPQTPAAGPAALSSILLLVPGFILGDIANISIEDFLVMAIFGITFSIASVTFSEGMRRVPAGEAALISLLETPLAPIFGFLFFTEIPAFATLIGGAIILAAVIWSQLKKV